MGLYHGIEVSYAANEPTGETNYVIFVVSYKFTPILILFVSQSNHRSIVSVKDVFREYRGVLWHPRGEI